MRREQDGVSPRGAKRVVRKHDLAEDVVAPRKDAILIPAVAVAACASLGNFQ